MIAGEFYHIRAGQKELPDCLGQSLPRILWIPDSALSESTEANNLTNDQVILCGRSIKGTATTEEFPLVWMSRTGKPTARFNISSTIDCIVLEEYHDGLEPTIEMQLPFNYSLLPNWAKGVGRYFRGGKIAAEPTLQFSCENFPPVDWLRKLGQLCSQTPPKRISHIRWPDGYSAALTISHDVDTAWLFQNIKWLDRICDIEERSGLCGAWYCVPKYSESHTARKGMQRLLDLGCELGCHGYNHDAKWPLLSQSRFERRLRQVKEFQAKWKMKGFRSEWLWRTPKFLEALSKVFEYDSSIPTVATSFTSHSRNGCGTCFPFLTNGQLLELPLTVPMDEARHIEGLDPSQFWAKQVELAKGIVNRGRMVMLSLHPQNHQAANDATLIALEAALEEIVSLPGVWKARPDQIADWVRPQLTPGKS